MEPNIREQWTQLEVAPSTKTEQQKTFDISLYRPRQTKRERERESKEGRGTRLNGKVYLELKD